MANPLLPVFLHPDRLRFLLVGAGEVGLEKLHNLLRSSPTARVRVVAPEIRPEVRELAARHAVELIKAPFAEQHLKGIDVVIVGTANPALNGEVHRAAKAAGKLVNVADTPALCDFYNGSVVTKGDLKLGISTNGKSPTFAKRLREVLEDSLDADDLDTLLAQLYDLRERLRGDFSAKVQALNAATASLRPDSSPGE